MILSSGFGRYKTRSVTIDGGTGRGSVSAETATTIIAGLKGIEKLTLRYFYGRAGWVGLSNDFLHSSSLSGTSSNF